MDFTPSSTIRPSLAIGIDFGTTFCCVAVLSPPSNRPQVIQSAVGKNTTPSYVAYNRRSHLNHHTDRDSGGVCVGEGAKQVARENPENTIFDIRRLIGGSYEDPNIQKYKELLPFHLVNIAGRVGVRVEDDEELPEVIGTELFRHLKKTSEDFLGDHVDSAVVTIPVSYNDVQQDLVRVACEAAGFTNIELIAAPVAAALSYGLQTSSQSDTTRTCLIYNLGGGTFDVAVFQLDFKNQVEVKATGGDGHLGGQDFDDLLTQFCVNEFNRIHGVDLVEGKTSEDAHVRNRTAKTLRRIRTECEVQKRHLSSLHSVVISVDKVDGQMDLTVTLTRSKFEDLIHALLTRSIQILEATLNESGSDKNEIHDVILIGGSSRISKVRTIVQEYFGGKQIRKLIDGDEAVACGAAIFAHNSFTENKALLSTVTLIEPTQAELQPLVTVPPAQAPHKTSLPKTIWWLTQMGGFLPRESHGAVAVGKTIYSFGGFHLGHPSYSLSGFLDIFALNVDESYAKWKRVFAEHNGVNPAQRFGHSVVAHKEFVFIFGGFDTWKRKYSNSMYRFNTQTIKWDKPKVSGNLPAPRYHHSAVTVRNQLIVFGGNGGSTELHIFDMDSFHWSTIQTQGTAPSDRGYHSATVYNDTSILVFGGYNYDFMERRYVNTVESFDLNTITWSVPPTSGTPPKSRICHSAFMHQGIMYIFGGENSGYFNDLFSYDPETFKWKEVTLPVGHTQPPRRNAGCVAIDDRVFIFGGYNGIHLDDTSVLQFLDAPSI